MIAAAVAAMIGSAQAVTCVKGSDTIKDPCTGEKTKVTYEGSATAHKVAISLKTTVAKSKKGSSCSNCTFWREQKTVKINGLLWELLSDTDCVEDCVLFGKNTAFWTDAGALDVEFAIGAGLIGKDTGSKKAEAYGSLVGADFGELAWAGFGSMAGSKAKGCSDCTMYLKSISGGIAGKLIGPDDPTVCGCDPIAYDGCCGDLQLADTAAYGTIKITYDAATAKKVVAAGTLGQEDDITAFYKLPAAAALDYAEEVVTPGEVVIEE